MSYLDETEWRCEREPEKLVFYRPPLREMVRHLEWGWVLIAVLALACLAMPVAGLAIGRSFIAMTILAAQLLLMVLAVPLFFCDTLSDRAIRSRVDPFCIHCGRTLIGLAEEGRCPDCGRPYCLDVVKLFRRDPQWVRAYWRFAGRPPTAAEAAKSFAPLEKRSHPTDHRDS